MADETVNIFDKLSKFDMSLVDSAVAAEILYKVFESIADALVIINIDGFIVLVNGKTETLFGYTRHNLIGQSIEWLIPEDMRKAYKECCDDYMENPSLHPDGIELTFNGQNKQGRTFPVGVHLTLVEVSEKPFLIASVRSQE